MQVGNGVTATLTGTISQGGGSATQPLIFEQIGGTGTGTFVLTSGANDYNGLTTINAGTTVVERNTGTALGSGGVLINSGAVLRLDFLTPEPTYGFYPIEAGTISGAGTLRFTSTDPTQGFSFGNVGIVNVALGSGALIDVQSGTVHGSASNQGVWTNNLADLTIAANATFDTVEGTVRVDALNGAGTLRGGFNGTRTFTLGVDNGSGTFSGAIQNGAGAGSVLALAKVGTGTQTLTGANTYTGATTISGGTLAVSGGAAIGDASGGHRQQSRYAGPARQRDDRQPRRQRRGDARDQRADRRRRQ